MQKVFIKSSQPHPEMSYDVGTIMERAPAKGAVGIEIEVEGNKFPKRSYKGSDPVDAHLIPKVWNYHKDGSLRGKDNAEYVLFKPIEFNEVSESLTALWDMFKNYGTVLDVSNRTSVHVHLNVQRWHLNRLCTFMAMYFSLEEILTQWCGEHRVGNLFCLRAKDAPGIISKLKKFLVSNGTSELSEGLHYAGFNAHAIGKFGSIEVRTLRGCQDKETILDWIEILRALYEKSEEFTDPRSLMEDFSGNGPLAYLDKLLGDKAQCVLDGISMTSTEVQDSIYDGIRMAQDLTYCRDWSLYKPVDITKDPFGRATKDKVELDINLLKIKTLGQTYAIDIEAAQSPPIPHNLWETPQPEPAMPYSPTPDMMAKYQTYKNLNPYGAVSPNRKVYDNAIWFFTGKKPKPPKYDNPYTPGSTSAQEFKKKFISMWGINAYYGHTEVPAMPPAYNLMNYNNNPDPDYED